MKIKRIKKLKVNSYTFDVIWDKNFGGGSFQYGAKNKLTIGIKDNPDSEIWENICHEVMEICATEVCVRYARPDCNGDYIFVYDHRQHDTMINMFAGLVSQFIAD